MSYVAIKTNNLFTTEFCIGENIFISNYIYGENDATWNQEIKISTSHIEKSRRDYYIIPLFSYTQPQLQSRFLK